MIYVVSGFVTALIISIQTWSTISNKSPLVDRIEQAHMKDYLEEAFSVVASVGAGDTAPSSSAKGQGEQIPSKSL
jgi:hypothetical protein